MDLDFLSVRRKNCKKRMCKGAVAKCKKKAEKKYENQSCTVDNRAMEQNECITIQKTIRKSQIISEITICG